MTKFERCLQIVLIRVLWGIAAGALVVAVVYVALHNTFSVQSFDTTQDTYAVGETIYTTMQFTSYDKQRIREDVALKCGEYYYPIRMVSYTSNAAKNAKATILQGVVPQSVGGAIGDPKPNIECRLNVAMHVTYRVAGVMDRTVSKYFSSNIFDVTK